MSLKQKFTDKVLEVIKMAEEMYNVNLGDVEILYNLSGSAAGYAGRKVGAIRKYYLRFNAEAILDHWDDMYENTIPHEIAHLVSYADKSLGAVNHNAQWKKISESLGDKTLGERCHSYNLTKARKTKKYIYKLPLFGEHSISSIKHNRIQKYGYVYILTSTGDRITKEHFTGRIIQQ